MLCVTLTLPLTVSASESDDGLPHPEDVLVYDDASEDIGAFSTSSDIYVMPMAVTATVYPGSISTTYLDYFKGVMAHRPGTPYVVFRSDQYNYYLFYGEDLVYSNGNFTGAGSYVRYYTTNGYVYRGTDTLSVSVGYGFVYSNMSDEYPAFYEERDLLNAKTVLFVVVGLLCLWVFARIFFRKS